MMETRDGWTFSAGCRADKSYSFNQGKEGCEHCTRPAPWTFNAIRWRMAGFIGGLGLYLAWKLTPPFPPWVDSLTGPKCPPPVPHAFHRDL